MSNIAQLPNEVEINYRRVGDTHVFTSKGIKGVVHCGSSDLEDAFGHVAECLSHHISEEYECEAVYTAPLTFGEFELLIASDSDVVNNGLMLQLDMQATSCH
jgi:hypothetical protein